MIHVESRPRCSAGYECRQCDEAIGPIPSSATPGKNQVNGKKILLIQMAICVSYQDLH